MPLIRIHWIVVDPLRRTEALATVGATGEHHVRSAAAERLHTCQHINIVVCRATRTVNCQEALTSKPSRIDRAAKNQAAAQIDLRALIERWCDARVLSITGANAPERATKVLAPPIKTLPLLATSSVPHTGEFGIKMGLIQVAPLSVERLNCRPPQLLPPVLQAWYRKPCPIPWVVSIVNHCLSPPVTSAKVKRVHA